MIIEIALLIPHFNNPIGLGKTISSISENVDIYIVDDGSEIQFDEVIISKLYSGSGNIYFIYLKENFGIERALNEGISEIIKKSYKYIARMDCGDIVCNDRFRKQMDYLKNNSNVYLIGSWVDFINESGDFFYRLKVPSKHREIKRKMYINCMFIHPTVMFKIEAVNLIGDYPIGYKAAEDYAYFFKFVKNFTTHNIPEVLVRVEYNQSGISVTNRKRQIASRIKVIIKNFYFGIYPIYGLMRNLILFIIPLRFLNLLKRHLK